MQILQGFTQRPIHLLLEANYFRILCVTVACWNTRMQFIFPDAHGKQHRTHQTHGTHQTIKPNLLRGHPA